ncbi:hypothetical protein Sbal625DRAFT_3095 [Shewanella baltica OS625]|nr:hypothetical protein Sbal625DRAFT_3095 [Shewanella baltica OS625]
MHKLVEVFCDVDDFSHCFHSWLAICRKPVTKFEVYFQFGQAFIKLEVLKIYFFE